jgi:methionyl-tRNA formyltransferase
MGAHFIETRNVADSALQVFWEAMPLDLMLCVSWRYLIPRSIYTRPRLGTYILHDSPLPQYRGFAPSVWAIVNGEDCTGATLFAAADKVDAGDIIDQREIPFGPDDTIAEVMEAVTKTYLSIIEESIPRILNGTATAKPQDQSQATFTCKRMPEDNLVDWTEPTMCIHNLIRGVTRPYPGAFTSLFGKRMIVWRARRLSAFPEYVGRVPGRVVQVQKGIGSVVLTGDSALLVTEVQSEGEEACRADLVLDRISLTLGR